MEQHRHHLTATVHGVDVVLEPVIPVKIAVTAKRAQALTRAGQPVPDPVTVSEALLDTGAHQCHIKAEIAQTLGLPIEGAGEPEYVLTFGGVPKDPVSRYEATVEILGGASTGDRAGDLPQPPTGGRWPTRARPTPPGFLPRRARPG